MGLGTESEVKPKSGEVMTSWLRWNHILARLIYCSISI